MHEGRAVARRLVVLSVLAFAAFGGGRSARAEEGERHWYGGWVAASDIASDLIMWLPPQADRTDAGPPRGVGYLGLAGAAFGGPTIHALRGHPTRALGSFGVRALFMGVGLLAHAAFASECWKEFGTACDRSERLFFLIPLATGQVIDAAALAWEPRANPARGVALSAAITPRGPQVTVSDSF
jgi:hypothetical protein